MKREQDLFIEQQFRTSLNGTAAGTAFQKILGKQQEMKAAAQKVSNRNKTGTEKF